MGDWENRIQRPVKHLAEQLGGIRDGTISIGFVETFRVPCQGGTQSINRLASITRQGDRIVVAPFDRAMVPMIVKALADAKQNAYALDPQRIAVSVPPISGEQREQIARHVKSMGEEAKVAVRSVRQEIRKYQAAAGKRSDRTIQELTDHAIEQIDGLLKKKLDELGVSKGGR